MAEPASPPWRAFIGLGSNLGDRRSLLRQAIEGLRAEKFVILPHENVAQYMKLKTENYDRWIGGMVKLRRRVAAARAAFYAKEGG